MTIQFLFDCTFVCFSMGGNTAIVDALLDPKQLYSICFSMIHLIPLMFLVWSIAWFQEVTFCS